VDYPLETPYQQFIFKSRYSRWIEEEKRREDWNETVDRYYDFMTEHLLKHQGYKIPKDLKSELWEATYNLEVMPSMRALMTAGIALERCNVAGYNCAYMPIESMRCFDELLYILMCGAGVGFSVERNYIDRLPIINEHFERSTTCIVVGDSKAGWARGLRELIALLVVGQIPVWDTSQLRPAGARLKTFGGRSSGPGPLEELFRFTSKLFQDAKGRRLSALECHDLCCKIGSCVVSGGVRRSALISLSNISDIQMREAKSGNWSKQTPYRALANNSWVAKFTPDIEIFTEEWLALIRSKSGERGIFNRQAAIQQAGRNGRRDTDVVFGCNPCSEIILRPYQFCNLTEVVARDGDSLKDLQRKVSLASILGTFQATLTNFKYLRKVWKTTTESERLLGVSLTGVCDNTVLSDGDDGFAFDKFGADTEDLGTILKRLKDVAIDTNKKYSEIIGIPRSAAITCNKPSGTVSQFVLCSSGIHAAYSEYYIRSVRGSIHDPLATFLKDQGIPCEPAVGSEEDTVVFYFPQKSSGKVTRHDMGAIRQLEFWKIYNEEWCEHKPSCTIYVKENEWLDVGAWVYRHFDQISGLSFLPFDDDDHTYVQAPYRECTKEEYELALSKMPETIDWNLLSNYETEDTTISSQEFACTGGVCEIVDIGK
jgi:ribonucleoside-triphosphate reductase (thioredoxin)